MNRYDLADHQRIIAGRAERAAYIEALQAEFNRCAWDGVAVVDAGQPFCLTHDRHEIIELVART